MDDLDQFLVIVRVLCILIVAGSQISIAYSLWQFTKRGVAMVSAPNWVTLAIISSVALTVSAIALVAQSVF